MSALCIFIIRVRCENLYREKTITWFIDQYAILKIEVANIQSSFYFQVLCSAKNPHIRPQPRRKQLAHVMPKLTTKNSAYGQAEEGVLPVNVSLTCGALYGKIRSATK